MPACAGKHCPTILKLRMRIRELEAAMNRGPFPNRATCADITKATADYYGLSPIKLMKKDKTPEICTPRMIAMYLCRTMTTASLSTIGRHFGGKHHTTVLHACRKIYGARYEQWVAMALRDIGQAVEKLTGRRERKCQEKEQLDLNLEN